MNETTEDALRLRERKICSTLTCMSVCLLVLKLQSTNPISFARGQRLVSECNNFGRVPVASLHNAILLWRRRRRHPANILMRMAR